MTLSKFMNNAYIWHLFKLRYTIVFEDILKKMLQKLRFFIWKYYIINVSKCTYLSASLKINRDRIFHVLLPPYDSWMSQSTVENEGLRWSNLFVMNGLYYKTQNNFASVVYWRGLWSRFFHVLSSISSISNVFGMKTLLWHQMSWNN